MFYKLFTVNYIYIYNIVKLTALLPYLNTSFQDSSVHLAVYEHLNNMLDKQKLNMSVAWFIVLFLGHLKQRILNC